MASLYELEHDTVERDGWRIENDQTAEWALRKIAEAKAEIEKWETFYAGKMAAIRKDCESTIDYMTFRLQEYFDIQPKHITKTGIEKYSLPSAELIRKPGGLAYKYDDAELLAWCETHLPNAIKETVTRKAGWAEVKNHIKETGEIPDCVAVEEKAPVFQVK